MEKYNDIKNRVVSVVFAVALAILILTFSIGLPIYFRPFYYIQIDTLDMVERTGYSYEVIKAAYDEVLNYLTLPWCEFGTGELAWSESGASHFADCLFLFNLNAVGNRETKSCKDIYDFILYDRKRVACTQFAGVAGACEVELALLLFLAFKTLF